MARKSGLLIWAMLTLVAAPLAVADASPRLAIDKSMVNSVFIDFDGLGIPHEAQLASVGREVVAVEPWGRGRVWFLNASTMQVTQVTSTGLDGQSIITDGRRLWIIAAVGSPGNLTAWDTRSRSFSKPVKVCPGSRDGDGGVVAGNRLYIACWTSIVALDAQDLSEIRRVSIPAYGMVPAYAAGKLWVSVYPSGSRILDADSLDPIRFLDGCWAVRMMHVVGDRVFCVGLSDVDTYDLSGNSLSQVSLPQGQWGNYYSAADNDGVWVSAGNALRHVAAATGQVDEVIEMASRPSGVVRRGTAIWVSDSDGKISRIGNPSESPDAPTGVQAIAGPASATVSWLPPQDAGSTRISSYNVTATPGGQTCVTEGLSCEVTGLSNRRSYTFTVTATNAAGTSDSSSPSAAVMPLDPGFQTWSEDGVLAIGSGTTVRVAQAAAAASITITGSVKSTLIADSAGFGSTTFTATKSGIHKFTSAYSVKVGKKTTKYTASTWLYVPSLSGPMLKIMQGKSGKFSLQFMPPGAVVSIALSDGRTLTGTADSAGKASFTPTFNTLGAVTYTATVAGVQIGTGGLTVTK